MAESNKVDPVDLLMWVGALVLFVLTSVEAAFLFGWFGGLPGGTEEALPMPTATPTVVATVAPAPTSPPAAPTPTAAPVVAPAAAPTAAPTTPSTPLPTVPPSPSPVPTASPSPVPPPSPTASPSPVPTATAAPPPPAVAPAKKPPRVPTPRPTPKRQPTAKPTPVPAHVATVDIISDPPGAEVILAGRSRGRTPVRIGGLLPGAYPLQLRKEGYAPYEKSVRVGSDAPEYTVQVTLVRAVTASSFISVTSEPPGASVKLNGKPAGQTPVNLGPLEAGSYEVTIEYETFPVQTRTVNVGTGTLHSLKVRFGGQ